MTDTAKPPKGIINKAVKYQLLEINVHTDVKTDINSEIASDKDEIAKT